MTKGWWAKPASLTIRSIFASAHDIEAWVGTIVPSPVPWPSPRRDNAARDSRSLAVADTAFRRMARSSLAMKPEASETACPIADRRIRQGEWIVPGERILLDFEHHIRDCRIVDDRDS